MSDMSRDKFELYTDALFLRRVACAICGAQATEHPSAVPSDASARDADWAEALADYCLSQGWQIVIDQASNRAVCPECSARERRELALKNAAARYPLTELHRAVEDLRYRRGFIFDFPPIQVGDDRKFEALNPDHPCAASNRFRRQKAADFFALLVVADPSLVSTVILDELHQSLFDRDPAIRKQIADTLGALARPESAEPLERLVQAEDESQWVRDAALSAIARCRLPG